MIDFIPEHLHQRGQVIGRGRRARPNGRVRPWRDLLSGARIGGSCHLVRCSRRAKTTSSRSCRALLHAREGAEQLGGRTQARAPRRRKPCWGSRSGRETFGADFAQQGSKFGRLHLDYSSGRSVATGIEVGYSLSSSRKVFYVIFGWTPRIYMVFKVKSTLLITSLS